MTSERPERSTGELVQRLNDAVATLLGQELRQARAELTDKARQGATGAALLGGAGALSAAALATSTLLLVRMLERFLPRPLAAAAATAILGGAAVALATRGVRDLRNVNPIPEQTLSSVRADVESVTRATTPDQPNG